MSAGRRPSSGLFDTLAQRELLSRQTHAIGEREPYRLTLRPRLPYAFDDSGSGDPNGLAEITTEWTRQTAAAATAAERTSGPEQPPSVERGIPPQPVLDVNATPQPLADRRQERLVSSAAPHEDDGVRQAPQQIVNRIEQASRTNVTRLVDRTTTTSAGLARGIEARTAAPAALAAPHRQRVAPAAPSRRDRIDPFRPAGAARDTRDMTVEIHIGRLDVRASVDQWPARSPRRERPADTRLADYLRARTSGASS